jgi:hypothetical protein
MTTETDDPFSHLARPDELTSDVFPQLGNLSAAWIFRFLPIPAAELSPPEYVYILTRPDGVALDLFIAWWNFAWESGPLRHQMFSNHSRVKIPAKLEWIKKFQETNFRFVPLAGRCRYPGYVPLYHLMPLKTLRKFGLPPLKRGLWPTIVDSEYYDGIMPPCFENRLSEAFCYHLWPLLCPGSPPSAFSPSEPIRVLAHGLDFWLPYIDIVAQRRMKDLGRVKIEDAKQAKLLKKLKADCPPEFTAARPLFGGDVWHGEAEAWEATKEMVEVADRNGHLRGILDAVRSNRVEEDFSSRWSFEREDFERKLYRKRNKIKVQFVELEDTIPVHGPETDVEENLLWQSLFAILSPKERRVAICLRSGVSKAGAISQILGYANHSPVSKALKRIREKLRKLFHE